MNYIRHIKDLVHFRYVHEICIYGNELFEKIKKRTESISHYLDDDKFNIGCFIKSEESIARKILFNLKTQAKDFLNQTNYDYIDKSFEDEIVSMRDVFRMNFELDVDEFENELKSIIEVLLAGNSDIKYANHFDNTFNEETMGYKDLKIGFKYKGYFFEIQFHTRESNLLNKKTHGIYEVFRNMEPCDERESLKLDRNRLFKDLQMPIIDEQGIIELIKDYDKE